MTNTQDIFPQNTVHHTEAHKRLKREASFKLRNHIGNNAANKSKIPLWESFQAASKQPREAN